MLDGPYTFWHALIGGVLIGLASLLGVLASGKIPGISGVCARLIVSGTPDKKWRFVFLVGLIVGAALMFSLGGVATEFTPQRSLIWMAVAGLFVGFGTRIGGGCTSGHGVCGMGMGARDSIVATLTFMGAGIATVYVFKFITS